MTNTQEQYIIDNFNLMSVEALRKAFNEKFDTDYKVTAFHYHTNRLGLKKINQHNYTALEDEFLRINSNLMTREELTRAFNNEFKCSIKLDAIAMRCWQKGFVAQSDGKFKNGSVPWEKTIGGREEYVKTLKGGNSASFKKGNVPMSTRPIGSVRVSRDETYIKTEYGWRNPRTVAFEEVNGKIPKGWKVFAVDGNNDNTDIDNLRAIDNYTVTVLMSNGWLDKGAEIFDAGVQYAHLKRALQQ